MDKKKAAIEELNYHINALNTIVLGMRLDQKPCLDIIRSLEFSICNLREKRQSIDTILLDGSDTSDYTGRLELSPEGR